MDGIKIIDITSENFISEIEHKNAKYTAET